MAQTLYINVKGDTKDLVNDLKKAENVTVTSGRRMTNSLGGVERAYGAIKAAVVAYLGVQTVRSVIEIADTYSLLESRLKLVTSSTEELKSVQASLLAVSNESRVSYASTANLYARLGRSTENLGTSTEDLLKVTEAISKALIVSGATATEAENSLIQLSQGLASGTLRGDELRSVLEQVPRVAKAIAEGMGITVGQLREFGKEGKLTAEAIIPAMISQLGKINEEFAQIDVTVGQATIVLKNAFFDIINDASKSSGMTRDLSGAILDMSKVITENKEPIISVFVAIVDSVSAVISTVAALSNSFAGFKAVSEGRLSFFDLAVSNAEELKILLEEIGDESSATNRLRELSAEQEILSGKLKEDRSARKLFGDDSKRISKEAKKSIIDRISNIKQEKKAWLAVADIIKNEYTDSWRNANKVIVADSTKAVETIEKKNDDLFKSVVRESQKTTKIRKDNWQIQLKDRIKVIDRMEKAQEQATKNELKVSEKAHADEMKLNAALAMSIEDGWLQRDEGAKEAYARLDKYGEDYFRGQTQIWEDLGGHTEQFFIDLQDTGSEAYASISGLFSNFASDLIEGDFKNIGDAWDSLWKGALQKLGDVVIEMAVTWAASKVGNLFQGWDIFHAGVWNLKDDEVPSILQQGEMVIPKQYAEIIRNQPGIGSFEGLTGHLGTDVGAWDLSDRFGKDLSPEMKSMMAKSAIGVMMGVTSPASAVSGIAGQGLSALGAGMLGYSPDPLGLGWSGAYDKVGGFIGQTGTALGLGGGFAANTLGPLGSMLGGYLGDRLGDLLGDREFEAMRDIVEREMIDPAAVREFAARVTRLEEMSGRKSSGASSFGGFFDAISNAISSAIGAVQDAFGFGGVSEGGGGGQSEGFGDRESSPGGMGGVHGGMDFIPKETTYMLDKGERVLSPNQNSDLTSFLRNPGKSEGDVTVNVMMNGRALNSIIEDVIVERNNSTIAPTGRLYGY